MPRMFGVIGKKGILMQILLKWEVLLVASWT
jgi:hypothetical protein